MHVPEGWYSVSALFRINCIISSSEEKINQGKVEALKEASDLAIDIAEEIINNLYVKKVDKKDLNKFSKDLN